MAVILKGLPVVNPLVSDFMRALLAATAMVAVLNMWGAATTIQHQALVLLQQAEPGAAALMQDIPMTLFQWAVREGGAWGIILVILFFYRRDWKTATDFWREQNQLTGGMIEKATAALTANEHAIRENTIVTHRLKDAVNYANATGRWPKPGDLPGEVQT